MTSIQNHPRFKKDCEKYLLSIKECSDERLKSELKSLYDQMISLVKEIDSGFNMLVSERLTNKTQQEEIQSKLSNIRVKLEEKISTANQK